MGTPQLGPGKAERFETHQLDIGRMRVTGREEDAYAFRTPSLRNVARTGPWGHAGAHSDLAAFLRHHADPVAGLAAYTPQATLPDLPGTKPDWTIMEAAALRAEIEAAVSLSPVALNEDGHRGPLGLSRQPHRRGRHRRLGFPTLGIPPGSGGPVPSGLCLSHAPTPRYAQ
jgi:hypothetical protein